MVVAVVVPAKSRESVCQIRVGRKKAYYDALHDRVVTEHRRGAIPRILNQNHQRTVSLHPAHLRQKGHPSVLLMALGDVGDLNS